MPRRDGTVGLPPGGVALYRRGAGLPAPGHCVSGPYESSFPRRLRSGRDILSICIIAPLQVKARDLDNKKSPRPFLTNNIEGTRAMFLLPWCHPDCHYLLHCISLTPL